jgi:hypothetical protein
VLEYSTRPCQFDILTKCKPKQVSKSNGLGLEPTSRLKPTELDSPCVESQEFCRVGYRVRLGLRKGDVAISPCSDVLAAEFGF